MALLIKRCCIGYLLAGVMMRIPTARGRKDRVLGMRGRFSATVQLRIALRLNVNASDLTNEARENREMMKQTSR